MQAQSENSHIVRKQYEMEYILGNIICLRRNIQISFPYFTEANSYKRGDLGTL